MRLSLFMRVNSLDISCMNLLCKDTMFILGCIVFFFYENLKGEIVSSIVVG